ncbi:ADP-heptose--LPS heptosyltransferase II [Xenorhabdus mauleonii]|uniref:ADP-heptose--LPS heptosyltransferase II n=1 Tax=Xenorhabdus mauleonii TaxID=351675 RepID=A0A1I3TXX1_9GAMM|nr:glycosyltransferase family 9 protein [Xenorhabdus mauleonii]PHM39598.1 ADP-heptose--LPS heptosyltransferase II [Xenorhabdus mauleonii]SFJ74377.1 ADP-heptose:LPS heptosyltransferase [Xenorhabdus mauleonii]
MQPKNILIIDIARIGDTLLVTPVIRALKAKWPSANIDVLAHKKTKEILEHIDTINELKAFSKGKAKWCGWFSRQQYELALVYGHDKSLVQYAKRKANLTIYFSDISEKKSHEYTVAKPLQLMLAQQERALLLNVLGVEVNDWRLQYCVNPDEEEYARDFLQRQGLVNQLRIGFQLQSFPAKAYRDWPVEYFHELAQRIYCDYPHAHILLLGSKEGEESAQKLADKLGANRCTSLAGQTTMRQNAAIMSQLDLYIGVDTGTTHLAGALGIPMVALYHSFHPGRFLAPQQHPKLMVIEHPVDYQQATRQDTMSAIAVEQVWHSAKRLLESKRKDNE